MRDLERLREKHEFALDDRQIAALSFCAALLLSGVFGLGLVLGRHSAPQPAAQPDLTAMDEAAKRQPPRAREVPAPVKPEPAEEEPAEQGKPPESIPAQPPPQQHATAQPQPPPQQHAPVQPPQQHAQAQPVAAPPAARAPMVVPPPPRPVQVASAGTIELTPPPKDPGAFTVQVGASQDKAEARKLMQRALAAGLKPYVLEADLGPKGTWYRVRVGAFADKDAATRFRKDVERELRAAAVVMPAR